MKIFHKRLTAINALVFALLILVPILVFAAASLNTIEGGFRFMANGTTNKRAVRYNTNNNPATIETSTSAYCFSVKPDIYKKNCKKSQETNSRLFSFNSETFDNYH